MKINKIFVTKPSLPDLKDLIPYLEKIWHKRILSNGGPFHVQLEEELCKYLGVPYVSLVSNCTIGLIIALKVMDIKGEVITAPYSFIATANSLIWNNLKPVFVDIDPVTANLDPGKIEAAITSNTSAIMPTHVYGYPCDVDKIESIARKYNLKVIYDAAHAFGVKCHCGSVLQHGDMSVLSFHATKVFNTFEGGAIICKDKNMKKSIDEFKNFGFSSEVSAEQIGLNGKMSEFNAALGLLQLKKIDSDIEKRKAVDAKYRLALKDIPGIRCHVKLNTGRNNYGYFPIFVDKTYPLSRDDLYEKFRANQIFARRYWNPLITDFSVYQDGKNDLKKKFINSTKIVESVICLPIYPELSHEDIDRIVDLVRLN